MADAINYINKSFTNDLSLDFIVRYSHMSRADFCRKFKKECGSTFLRYVNNLRAAYAHSLLSETDMPVSKIAEKAGFSSVIHLDRIFKSIHGISPSELRRRERSKP